jgi:glutaredoxin-related protein
MEQGVRIRLYGKQGCEQCDKAKDKLKKMNLRFEFVDVTGWLEYSDDWRSRREETVYFHAAYDFYYPMPLPLFKFNNSDYLGYTDGLAKAKEVYRAVQAARREREEEEAAVAAAPVLEAVA